MRTLEHVNKLLAIIVTQENPIETYVYAGIINMKYGLGELRSSVEQVSSWKLESRMLYRLHTYVLYVLRVGSL